MRSIKIKYFYYTTYIFLINIKSKYYNILFKKIKVKYIYIYIIKVKAVVGDYDFDCLKIVKAVVTNYGFKFLKSKTVIDYQLQFYDMVIYVM